MSEPRRTLALCLACLVPATLALLGAIYVYVVWMVDPPVHTENWGEFSNAELAAVMACGVLAALGGSLLGVRDRPLVALADGRRGHGGAAHPLDHPRARSTTPTPC